MSVSERIRVCDDGDRIEVDDGDRIEVDDGDRIEVTGPALVRTPSGAEYEITTGVTLTFPVDSEVWVKLWPEESTRA